MNALSISSNAQIKPKTMNLIFKTLRSKKIAFLTALVLIQVTTFCQGNIQPLGFRPGVYKIKPKGATEVRAYCMDQFIETKIGNIYDNVRVGETSEVIIGGIRYLVQEAIDKGKISFEFTRSGANDAMYITVRNNTNQEVVFPVEKDGMVLANKGSTNEIKNVDGLLAAVPVTNVSRQHYIWFSHGFKDYIEDSRIILEKLGIIGEGQEVTVAEYLTKRNIFLEKNGIKGNTLIRQSFAGIQSQTVYDYDLFSLLDYKMQIRTLSESSGFKCYQLRYLKTGNTAKYYLDDGALDCFASPDNLEIVKHLKGLEEKTLIGFDESVSVTKRDALMYNMDRTKFVGVELTHQNINEMAQLLTPNPQVEKVSEVTFKDFFKDYSLDVEYKVNEKGNKIAFTSKSGGYLTKIRSWFLKLVGKQTDQTMMEILAEGQRLADRAYPGQRAKSNVKVNYSGISTSKIDSVKYLLDNSKGVYAYFPTNY
jgi:hypothetical protein